jgi:NAD(P)H-flavin reductase
VNELVLEVAGQPPFRWRAGQYLIVHSGADLQPLAEPFPYSIARADDGRDPAKPSLAIGPGSGAELLADVSAGAVLLIDGPFGSFTLEPAPGALLMGAGTGVAPLRAHVLEWLARGGDEPICLLAGARAEADLLWHVELDELARQHARFQYEPVLSQASAAWQGRTGRVQEHLPALLARLPENSSVRVCGAVGMVESGVARLAELGVTGARIAFESY